MKREILTVSVETATLALSVKLQVSLFVKLYLYGYCLSKSRHYDKIP